MSAAGRLGFVTECRLLPNGKLVGVVFIGGVARYQTAPANTDEEIGTAVRKLAERLEEIRKEKQNDK